MDKIWDHTHIKLAREEAGISAVVAGDMLKVTPEYISMIEAGKKEPSFKLALKMTVLYRRPLAFFLLNEKNFALV
jgi:DNA-binding XRE family transcriptional regulator